MNRSMLLLSALLVLGVPVRAADAPAPQLMSVKKIWDAGKHNAFTDLVRFRDRWWCTFREADDHVGGDGKIRVLSSTDGERWESEALVEEKDVDLRDPKFSITPDNRLMIVAGGSVYLGTKELKGRQPRVLFSADGRTWTAPQRVLGEGDWLWRVTWHEGVAYGTSYDITDRMRSGPEQAQMLKLYRSTDGVKWELIAPMEVSGFPNETTLRFLKSGELVALVRREAGSRMGWIGVSKPPFKRWTWHETEHRLGGPNFI